MKKKIIFIITLMLINILTIYPVMAENITACNTFGDDVAIDIKIPNTVSMIIRVIQIAVPIVLVIFGMIDLFKGLMASKEDEIKKGQQTFIKRLIAAAVIFFVIAIVKLLFSFFANDEDGDMMNCVDCFLEGEDSCRIVTVTE